MQGGAAEALGLIGDATAADAIGRLASPDPEVRRARPGARRRRRCGARYCRPSAFRLALYALVRLKAYDQLAAAVLDGSGQPKVRWWPVAYALQRIEDKRALPALLTLAKDPHPYTRAFAAKGLGGLQGRIGGADADRPAAASAEQAVVIESVRALGRIGDPRRRRRVGEVARGEGHQPARAAWKRWMRSGPFGRPA